MGPQSLEYQDPVIGSRCYCFRFSNWYYHLSKMLVDPAVAFVDSLLLAPGWLNGRCFGCSGPNMGRALQTILFQALHRYVFHLEASSMLHPGS